MNKPKAYIKRNRKRPMDAENELMVTKGEGRENERERNMDVWEVHRSFAPCTPPPGYPAHNPGMFPDWESNW